MTVASQSCESRLVSTFATNSTSSKTRSIAVGSSTFCQTGLLRTPNLHNPCLGGLCLQSWSRCLTSLPLKSNGTAGVKNKTNLYVPDSRRLSAVLDFSNLSHKRQTLYSSNNTSKQRCCNTGKLAVFSRLVAVVV